MRIDPQRLLRLGELIRHGSFRRAAGELGLTQPALSQSIAQMEAEVGVRLLDRTAQGVVPTIYGEVLAGHARAIEGQLQDAATRIAELSSGQRTRLSIGGLSGGPLLIMALCVSQMRDEMPELNTRLVEEVSSSILLGQIEDRRIDLAICHHLDDVSLEGFRAIPFFEAKRMLCVRRGHPAEGRLELKSLAQYPFASPSNEMGFQVELERMFQAAGVPLPDNEILVSNSVAAVKQIVANSDAFALLSDLSIMSELKAGALVAATVPSSQDKYWNNLVLRQDQSFNHLLHGFVSALVKVCRDLDIPVHPDAERLAMGRMPKAGPTLDAVLD